MPSGFLFILFLSHNLGLLSQNSELLSWDFEETQMDAIIIIINKVPY